MLSAENMLGNIYKKNRLIGALNQFGNRYAGDESFELF